jgi:hypothetical protein
VNAFPSGNYGFDTEHAASNFPRVSVFDKDLCSAEFVVEVNMCNVVNKKIEMDGVIYAHEGSGQYFLFNLLQ